MNKNKKNRKNWIFKLKLFYRTHILENYVVLNYRRMWQFIKPVCGRAVLGIAFTIPVGTLDAAAAALLKPFMDNVLVGKDIKFSVSLPLLIIALSLFQGGFNYAAGYMNSWVSSKITFSLKRTLYSKLLLMDTEYFDKTDSGKMLQRFSTDADIAAGGLIGNLKEFVTRFFSSISLLCVLVYNSWQLSIFSVAILLAAVYPLSLVRKRVKLISQKSVGASAKVTTHYNETFGGNKIIHSFALENTQKEKFKNITNDIFSLNMKIIKGSNWLSPFIHFIGSIGIAIALGFGSHLIVTGQITSGNFAAFIAALMMLYTPLRSIGNNFVAINNSFLAMDRVFQILDTMPKISSSGGTLDLSDIKNKIEFKNVTFSYDHRRIVLNKISFEIKVGETAALVGHSGGGKTTVSSLIPRLYEIQSGEILIDGTDIRQYKIESLRKNISMVFQDNFLFSGSIKDNILLANKDASDEQIQLALKSAYLDKFVESLPEKLDTQIGERGILLSGGQKQRVAIARAFLKNAPLVILDEATSALDNKAEKIVQQALDNLMKNKTVIVIAHRLSTVQNADKIIVISDGNIIEQGNHKELLAMQNGVYASLYETQFKK
jgi:subfamily B ATP-binding cassette protein MsbA